MKRVIYLTMMLIFVSSCASLYLRKVNLADEELQSMRELTFLMEPTPLLDRGFSKPIYIYQKESEFLGQVEADGLEHIFGDGVAGVSNAYFNREVALAFSYSNLFSAPEAGLSRFRIILKDRTKEEVAAVLTAKYGKVRKDGSWRPLRKYNLIYDGEPVIRIWERPNENLVILEMSQEYR